MPRAVAILAALSDQERDDFLPEPLWATVRAIAGPFRELNSEGLSMDEFHRVLATTNPEVLLTCWKTPPLPAALPPGLRYVCCLAGSVKRLLTRAHLEQGLRVTNWGGSISRTVAEAALLHILSGLRRATHWTFVMHREGGWKSPDTETASLFGRRVGLHGFGPVARELCALLRPFDCAIAVFAPDVTPANAGQFGVTCAASLEELFGGNDVIVELAPLIPATVGLVTERLLRLILPGGVFVNVGRGAVVDEAALLRIAREGRIRLGLDVFSVEPLPADSGFRGLPNVSLSPHLGGPTTDRRRDAGAFALENLRAYADGRPLQAVITPQVFESST